MTEQPLVIAIDGPAGSGKSTVAKAVAIRLGLDYLDTGAMYRSVAFAALRGGVDPEDGEVVGNLARNIEIEVDPTTKVEQCISKQVAPSRKCRSRYPVPNT